MVESSSQELIFITGITGYLGSHVALSLFNTYGTRFKLRASVRSLANKNKLEPLRKAFGEENYSLIEFVEADLSSKDALFKAIEGAAYIIHVANPLPGTQKISEEQMIQPAIQGMKTIIEASLQHKVKRIVVTSSLASVMGGVWKKGTGDNLYSEKDFAPPEGADAYGRSKIA